MGTDRLTKDESKIFSFLREFPLGTLATINVSGVPEVVVVYLLVEQDLSIFFVTKALTRKFKNIVRNPAVAILVYDERTLTSVEITGKVHVVEDTIEFARVIDKFHNVVSKRKGSTWLPPIAQIGAGDYVACMLRPRHITHRVFTNDTAHPKKPLKITLKL